MTGTLFPEAPCGFEFPRGSRPSVYCGLPSGHRSRHGEWTETPPDGIEAAPERMSASQAVAVSIAQQQHPPKSIQEAFDAFHAAHPEVYVNLVRLARRLIDRGYEHLGIGMLWETLRYQTMLGSSPDEDQFRLNNNYRSRYARLIMEQEPGLDGIFETRELTELSSAG